MILKGTRVQLSIVQYGILDFMSVHQLPLCTDYQPPRYHLTLRTVINLNGILLVGADRHLLHTYNVDPSLLQFWSYYDIIFCLFKKNIIINLLNKHAPNHFKSKSCSNTLAPRIAVDSSRHSAQIYIMISMDTTPYRLSQNNLITKMTTR